MDEAALGRQKRTHLYHAVVDALCVSQQQWDDGQRFTQTTEDQSMIPSSKARGPPVKGLPMDTKTDEPIAPDIAMSCRCRIRRPLASQRVSTGSVRTYRWASLWNAWTCGV